MTKITQIQETTIEDLQLPSGKCHFFLPIGSNLPRVVSLNLALSLVPQKESLTIRPLTSGHLGQKNLIPSENLYIFRMCSWN